MERSAMELISERLSYVEGLYFPRSTFPYGEAPSDPSLRRTALLDLLSRDASLFLERYGTELTAEELSEFDALKQDYEVGWHLNRIRSSRSPTAEAARSRFTTVKNRRRAYLEQLIQGGAYFSEDAMREREPYLHHEYVGRFQDPSGRGMSRPGERWSETLMRRSEEAILMAKIRSEQQRLGVARKDWVGNEGYEEQQEEEEEGKEKIHCSEGFFLGYRDTWMVILEVVVLLLHQRLPKCRGLLRQYLLLSCRISWSSSPKSCNRNF